MEDDVLVDSGVVWEGGVPVRSCYYDVVLGLCFEDMQYGCRELYLSLSVEDYCNSGFVPTCIVHGVGGRMVMHSMVREFKRSIPVDVLLGDDVLLVDFLHGYGGARGVFLCVGGVGDVVPVECDALSDMLGRVFGDKFRSYVSDDELRELRMGFNNVWINSLLC